MKTVLVFMSAYNGEKYIKCQLDSLLAQTGVEVHIYIRDDGSSDETRDILVAYSEACDAITYEYGENKGYAESFWQIFSLENKYDYYAFCDQDDFWLPDKLSSAVALLASHEGTPALYTSDVIPTDGEGAVIGERLFSPVPAVQDFYASLVRSILPGCTFVFNHEAFAVLSKYHGYKESHDWAVYTIVSAFGVVVFDPVSHIHYRLHGNNTLGKDNKLTYLKRKLKLFFSNPKRVRSRFAKDFYDTYCEELPQEYKDAAYHMGNYLEKKSMLLRDKHFGGVAFKLYTLLGKI